MTHAGFVHLRVHTAFSLSEGAIHIADLAQRAVQEHMPAVAMTDTNNLFGALEFSLTMAGRGVQPIIGCSLAIRNPFAEAEPGARELPPEPVGLLVQNEAGYKNLLKLVSHAHLETDPGDVPHVMLDELRAHSDGLVAMTGGPGGPVGKLLLAGRAEKAAGLVDELQAIFGDRLYMELMRHGMPEEDRTEAAFLELAYEKNIPLVATNDAYFLDVGMYEAHDALLCIADGAYVSQDDRRRLTPEHRLKSTDEMIELFADLPEAIENTLVIARRSGFAAATRDPILPNFTVEGDLTEAGELRRQAEEGLAVRISAQVLTDDMSDAEKAEKTTVYKERLDYELGVIETMGFPGYFLIVADFIRWAIDHNVPVGPGRGSGAGSVVAWALRITDLDPIRFGLIFERFLNPERVSMPDFDIDFCQDKRDQVIRYVQQKYGADQVAQIITFGKLQARAVLRDVGRVLQQPYPVTDRLSKMIPNNPAQPVTLAEAIALEPRLQAERDGDELTAAVIDRALKLEGLYRHASTHAAGVVIGDRPLEELIPLYRDPRSDMAVSGFSMKWVEKAGLVKFDFLGLKTLTVLQKAVEYMAERGVTLDLASIPLDDKATFEMLCAGDTAGVFQLESSGMRAALRGLKPDQFEEIIALVALYRPGPMDNIPTYINRKHGTEEVEYLHEWLKDVLDETYGVIIYQEQVMQIAQILAGYSLGEADLLRRAMGKKIKSEMDAQQKRFVDGAVAKGVPEERADFIFNLVAKFAGYGFNKSHAAAYGLVAYQTAYLKANYPVEFMAATMALDQQNTDKLGAFRMELQHMGVDLKVPDINKSGATFTVEAGKKPDEPLAIRYGLSAIKNVGDKAMASVVEERQAGGPFRDMFDLVERIDPKVMNKRQMENLVAAGAFDSLAPNRAQLMEAVHLLTRHGQIAAEQRASAQESLFGEHTGEVARPPLPDVEPWGESEQLAREHAAIGFYLSSHPLEMYRARLDDLNVKECAAVLGTSDFVGKAVKLAGAVSHLQERRSRTGKPFGYLSLSDVSGAYEVLVFSDFMEGARGAVEAGVPVVVTVSVEQRDGDDTPSLMMRSIESLEQVSANSGVGLNIYLDSPNVLGTLSNLLSEHKGGKGQVDLVLTCENGDTEVLVRLDRPYRVTPELRSAVASVSGVVDAQEA